ncbi:MAG: L(+)-tartrate dehydratase subunit alpha [Lachnospiraceae bacterium]|nr:L(+)-tartrate dehydratase subunit alpha [Lachnospiraceae bacterium]
MNDINLKLTEQLTDLISMAAVKLPDDLMKRLYEMKENETNPKVSAIYDSMLENQKMAVELGKPNCQDTGIIQCFVKAGSSSPFLASLEKCLREAAYQATKQVPLRPNVVAPFDETNDGTNVGYGVPFVEWDIVPEDDKIELDIYLAGGGCSLAGKSAVLMPSAGYKGVAEFVFDTVCDRAVNACPPMVVGVGIGACITTATKLSKKALLRTIGTRNSKPEIAEFEELLFDGINKLNIGPQGLGGKETAIGVSVEAMARHPASLGVSVSIGCWVHRHAKAIIDKNGNVTVLSHTN